MPRGFLQKKAPTVLRAEATPSVAQGAAAAPSGAWPVEVTDGTNTLGTAANPLVVAPVAVAADDGATRRLMELQLLRLHDLELLALRRRHGDRVSGLYFTRGRG